MSETFRFLVVTVIAVVFSVAAACSDFGSQDELPTRSVIVQAAWQDARTLRGHQVHVAQQHLRCSQCHELNDSIGAAPPARCVACHAQEGRIQHAEVQAQTRFGPTAKADCTSCHEFSLEQPSQGSSPTAHPARLTNSAGAPSGHLGALDGGVSHGAFTPADCIRCHDSDQGSTPAVVVHGSSDCLSCHRPHQDKTPSPGPCADCHREVLTQHAAHGKSAEQVCTTCHQHQHAPAAEALAGCATCHAKERPIVPMTALFEAGHAECVGCHRPHASGKQATEPCRSCHEDIHVLGARRVPAHNQCTSCHAPHDVRASPERACSGCHRDVHPDHPKLDNAHTCIGCHDPHPAGNHLDETARSCSSCHQKAHTDEDFHAGVACSQCHKPHAFALAKAGGALCNECHAPELGSVEARPGHQQCASCHRGLPHQPSSSLASCQSCHAGEHQQALSGHQQCTNCHEPHSGAQASACQSCHQAQARSAPTGHQQCTNCHQPHSGAATQRACSSCHVAEAKSAHGKLPGACADCHRAHGPSGVATPPACTSCHQTSSLLGLHQIAKHRDCSSCHSGHSERPALAREACLGCHADRKAHFPEAPRCASCHLFDTPR